MALFKKSKLKLRGTAIGSTGAKARSARMGAAGAQVHFPSDGFTVSGARVSPPGDEAAAVGIDETPGAVQPAAPATSVSTSGDYLPGLPNWALYGAGAGAAWWLWSKR